MDDYSKIYCKTENLLKINIKDRNYFYKNKFLEVNKCG
jgi:hypothetical protein